jgi:hypothetical protein
MEHFLWCFKVRIGFVTASHFQPSLIFEKKAVGDLSGDSYETPLQGGATPVYSSLSVPKPLIEILSSSFPPLTVGNPCCTAD